jgi:hypothetical protein
MTISNPVYKCYNDNQILVAVLVIIILYLVFNLINNESSMFSNLTSGMTPQVSRPQQQQSKSKTPSISSASNAPQSKNKKCVIM